MNDQQSEEMVKQLRRIAEALERISPSQPAAPVSKETQK